MHEKLRLRGHYMDKKIMIGIIAIILLIIAGTGVYLGAQSNTTINTTNTSNGSVNSSDTDKSDNAKTSSNKSTNNSKVNAQKTICKDCGGKGYWICNVCGGTGLISCNKCGGDGIYTFYNTATKKWVHIECSACGGDGKVTCPGGQNDCNGGKTTCLSCHGDGYFEPKKGDSYTIS